MPSQLYLEKTVSIEGVIFACIHLYIRIDECLVLTLSASI